ncbi:MAG: hypothetical protein ACLUPL_14185 [Butyricimonas virosa]
MLRAERWYGIVDGGISNNFPVDIAKAMGADIIIGVDAGGTEDASGLESVTGILDQMTSFRNSEVRGK